MSNRSKYSRVVSLTVALILLYIAESAFFPRIMGTVPSVLVPFTVAVGMCEGPYMGAGFGVAAGMLMDYSLNVFGFSSLLLLVAGAAAGLAVTYFRRTALTATAFTLAAGVFFFFVKWFFMYFLWHGGELVYRVFLQVLFAVLLSVPVYLLTAALSRKYGSMKSGRLM